MTKYKVVDIYWVAFYQYHCKNIIQHHGSTQTYQNKQSGSIGKELAILFN
jgi:hypothetical protein